MATIDKVVTIKGDAAQVSCVQVYPQPGGGCVVVVAGVTRDSEGRALSLKEAQLLSNPGQNAALDDLLNIGLVALRRINGLEDATPLATAIDTLAQQAAPVAKPIDAQAAPVDAQPVAPASP